MRYPLRKKNIVTPKPPGTMCPNPRWLVRTINIATARQPSRDGIYAAECIGGLFVLVILSLRTRAGQGSWYYLCDCYVEQVYPVIEVPFPQARLFFDPPNPFQAHPLHPNGCSLHIPCHKVHHRAEVADDGGG